MRHKPLHIDLQFIPNQLSNDDSPSIDTLNRFIMALVRCGRLNDAKCLAEHAGVPFMGAFLSLRQAITNPAMTPINEREDGYYLGEARQSFKEALRGMITMVGGEGSEYLFIISIHPL